MSAKHKLEFIKFSKISYLLLINWKISNTGALPDFFYHNENRGLHTQNSTAWDKMAEHSAWEI